VMRKIAGYLTKNRSGKDQKIAQSTHENEHIKPRKTFWRNSKQFLKGQADFSARQEEYALRPVRSGVPDRLPDPLSSGKNSMFLNECGFR
ncbi:MAG: hypothetical protein H9928_08190, partial [Candidatus Phocaeicola excrementipullorum]|nr:hypothetical protein [Candidatus Phocaeicola excrementipullorum]